MRKRQEGLRRKLEELAASTKGQADDRRRAELETLLRRQEIRQETLRLGRRLERLGARDAARSAAIAAEKMDDASRAKSLLTASSHAKEADELLADVDRLLRTTRAEVVARMAIEEQARLNDAVKHLHRQEQRIEAETREFAALERSDPLSRDQVFGLLELARQQTLLQDETDRLTNSLGKASTFRLGLSAASGKMRQAAGFLHDQQTGPATQQAEQTAIARLALLVAALEPESNDNSTSDDKIGGGAPVGQDHPGRPGTSGQSGGVTLLAEVKFLKLWQEDLNRRTQQLELDAAPLSRKRCGRGTPSSPKSKLVSLRPHCACTIRRKRVPTHRTPGPMPKRRTEMGYRIEICVFQLLLFIIGGCSIAVADEPTERPQRSTDDALRDSLDLHSGDDYDRELLGEPKKGRQCCKVRGTEDLEKKRQGQNGPAAQQDDRQEDRLLQAVKGMRTSRRGSRRGSPTPSRSMYSARWSPTCSRSSMRRRSQASALASRWPAVATSRESPAEAPRHNASLIAPITGPRVTATRTPNTRRISRTPSERRLIK